VPISAIPTPLSAGSATHIRRLRMRRRIMCGRRRPLHLILDSLSEHKTKAGTQPSQIWGNLLVHFGFVLSIGRSLPESVELLICGGAKLQPFTDTEGKFILPALLIDDNDAYTLSACVNVFPD